MRKDNLYIVLANSAAAKIYRYDLTSKRLELLNDLSYPRASLKVSDLMADDAGRYQKSGEPLQGAYAPHTDPKEIEVEKFAAKLSNELESITKEASNLVIIAPGNFQSFLKSKLKNPVLEKIEDYIDKDYTKLPIKDLEKHLSNILGLKF